MRAGGAAAPEHDGEDVGDLEQQARERLVRVVRSVVTSRTGADVERASQFEPRRQCSVEGAAWIGGSLVIIARQKGTMSGIAPCWQRSCKLEATPG